MNGLGIFCLEGEWDLDLTQRVSVLPILELLSQLGEAEFVHRNVSSIHEVDRYLSKWSEKRYDDYQILYLTAHGDRGRIYWSEDGDKASSSTLDGLAESLGRVAEGCYVYLASCLTPFDDGDLTRFVQRTGAKAVLGYRAPVDWLESAAFDVLLLPAIARHEGSPRKLFNLLMTRHGELAKHLRLVVGTKREILIAK